MATKKPTKATKSIDSFKNEQVDGKTVKGGVTGRVGSKISVKELGAKLSFDDTPKPMSRIKPTTNFPLDPPNGDIS